jgi:hypothetical protein
MSREQFEAYYAREQLPSLSSVKERHWQTWLEAQATILAAHGPAVEMRYLHETGPIDDEAWHRLRRKG